jgi:nucleoside-diphosphate-sugar epimerase
MSSTRKRVLVTGGAGFLGSHLCERLIDQGNDVLCVDNYFTGPINLGNPVEHSVAELAAKIVDLVGSRSKIEYRRCRSTTRCSAASTSPARARRWAGSRASPLETGLRNTIAYFDRVLTEGGEKAAPMAKLIA